MRVIHLIDSGGYYGAEVMLKHLCDAQILAGLSVEVISIGVPGDYEKPLEAVLKESHIPYTAWRMRPLPNPWEAWKIISYCQKTGADVIHSHGYKGNILIGLIPKFIRKIPFITTLHGYTRSSKISKISIYQWIDKKNLIRSDAVVVVGSGIKRELGRKILFSKKIHYIPNGIPHNEEPQEPHSSEKPPTFRILAIGRLSTEKNFQLIINSMPKIVEKIPEARLTIFGEGNERGNLEKLIDQLGMKNFIFLPGYIKKSYLEYRKADVFVNCSITEGMPITILEALKEGCLILASDIEANRAVLAPIGINNMITELSESAFFKSILEIRNIDSNDLATIKKILKKHFSENFTSEKSASAYEDLYKTLKRSR